MIQRPEAVGDITLNKPRGTGPGVVYLPQRGMTPSTLAEPVRLVRKPRLVIRLKEQAHHLADQLVRPRRQPQRAQLPVLLRDADAAGRVKPVPLAPHLPDDLIDQALGHAVGGFLAEPRRHRTLVGVDVAVSSQIQVLVEHLPVQLRQRQALPAALAENAQYHFGFLHSASLVIVKPFNACAPSPCGPSLAVSRLAGRYPCDYYGHSVALGLASLRRSHVRHRCTC